MSSLETVVSLANRQLQLENKVVEIEQELKKAKEDLDRVRFNDLPMLMEELELKDFTLSNGRKIIIKTDIYPYIKNDDKEFLYGWLKENNFASIIKASVTAAFEKGDARAEDVYQQLMMAGYKVTKKNDVHPQTFKKFVKECLEDGVQLPEQVQIQPINEAQIK